MSKKRNSVQNALDKQRENIKALIIKAGSQKAIGTQLGISQAAVSKWLVRGYVPLDRAAELEALYGVKREHLINPRVTQALSTVDSMLA